MQHFKYEIITLKNAIADPEEGSVGFTEPHFLTVYMNYLRSNIVTPLYGTLSDGLRGLPLSHHYMEPFLMVYVV